MSTINVGSALPSGTNTIGNVKLIDTGGTNQLAIDANNNAHVTIYNATNAMAVDASNNAHVGVWNGSNQLAVNSGGNAAVNLVQVGSSAVVTGTGVSGSGIARVTVSNDSQIQIWDGTTGPVAVKAANTPATLTDKSHVHTLSPNNTGLPVNLPAIVQKASGVTGSASKTLAIAFSSNTVKGNAIIVSMGMGEVQGSNITLTVTDSQSNIYTQAAWENQGSTLEAAIFYAVNIAGGANTVTITIAGTSSTTTAIAAEIYEVSGIVASIGALDQTATSGSSSSTTPSTGILQQSVPNVMAFTAVATGGGTLTAGTNWTLDSGTLSPTGGNLVSFGSESQLAPTLGSINGTITISVSNACTLATATFKTVALPIEGTVNLGLVNGTAISNTNPVPTQDIEQSGYVSASSPPSTTNAASDTSYTFSSQVSRIVLQNNTSSNVYFAFDTTASAGSLVLTPGSLLVYPKKCTVLHLYTATAQNINGTSASNIVVLGAL